MELEGEIPIGELSRRTGCNIETIRYYERIGLLPAPRRSSSRYRRYRSEDVRRLIIARRARELGFKLEQVRTLLRLASDCRGPCAEAREFAAAHLVDIRARIADLQAMERALEEATRQCSDDKPTCSVIDFLSTGLNRAV
jgi:MerR family transcriptional regulator, mercuric resistance operon regulatory protein